MKNLIILSVILISTSVVAQDKYMAGMGKGMELWGQGKSTEAAAMFERIGQAEKENWIPVYYAANALIVECFSSKDKVLNNERLEKAKGLIEEAHKRSSDNSEITTMEGLLYTAYVAMEPETYAMMYSPKIMQLHSKAIELDENNPRAYANLIEYEMGGAKWMGGDMKQFCGRFEKVIPLFENQDLSIPFAPQYGAERVVENMKACGCE